MKKYSRPTVDVVKLSVKENMAALPTSIQPTQAQYNHNGTDIPMTVYNIAAVVGSDAIGA